jgi:hypothetical protein
MGSSTCTGWIRNPPHRHFRPMRTAGRDLHPIMFGVRRLPQAYRSFAHPVAPTNNAGFDRESFTVNNRRDVEISSCRRPSASVDWEGLTDCHQL